MPSSPGGMNWLWPWGPAVYSCLFTSGEMWFAHLTSSLTSYMLMFVCLFFPLLRSWRFCFCSISEAVSSIFGFLNLFLSSHLPSHGGSVSYSEDQGYPEVCPTLVSVLNVLESRFGRHMVFFFLYFLLLSLKETQVFFGDLGQLG